MSDTIRVATLSNRISTALDRYEARLTQTVFRDDLPVLGPAFAGKSAEVLSFIADLRASIEVALRDLRVAVGIEATAAEIAAAFSRPDLPALGGTLRGDGTVDLTFNFAGALDLALSEAALALGPLQAGLALQGALDLAADIRSTLTLKVDPGSGSVTIDAGAGEEFVLQLSGDIDPGLDGLLGFLGLSFDPANLPGGPGIDLRFALDFAASGGIVASLSGEAGLTRRLATQVPTDILPSISADLAMGFGFDADLTVGAGSIAVDAYIGFDNIELDMGGLADFLNGVLGKIADIANTPPLGEIIEILTMRLPVIDAVAPNWMDRDGNGRITARDLVLRGGGDGGSLAYVDAVVGLIDALRLIGTLRTVADTVNLGGFRLTGEASASFGEAFDLGANGITAVLGEDLGGLVLNTGFGRAIALALEGGYAPSSGLRLPVIENPLETLGALLLNGFYTEPVTLMRYDLPRMDFAFAPSFPFNVGPIAFSIGGRFAADVHFQVGYDTAGFGPGGFTFADGFFVSTLRGGAIGPFAQLEFGLEVKGGVSGGVARVSAVGGLLGQLDLFLGGGQPKVRLADLSGCLFDPITGRLLARLEIEVKIGIGKLSVTERVKIGDVTLAQFDFAPCETDYDPVTRQMPGIALAQRAGPALELNVGADSDRRNLPGTIDLDPLFPAPVPGVNTRVIGETFRVSRAPLDAEGAFDPFALAVSAFGYFDTYRRPVGFDRITGDGGEGDDWLALDAGLAVAAALRGGAGNDLLEGGARGDRLSGDAGDDVLIGNAGDDTLQGGTGDDVLIGGAGRDLLLGGSGTDEADYSASDAAVTITLRNRPDGGEEQVGRGGHAEGDVLRSVEVLRGSDFDDLLTGLTAEDNVLIGGLGNDTLIGGAGDDLLAGGPGADLLRGGQGRDAVTYAFSPAGVLLDRRNGLAFGGDATGDVLRSIEIYQLSFHADTFFGTAAAETVQGLAGDDYIDAGRGADQVDGGGGADTIVGGAEGDTLDGGGIIYTGDLAGETDTARDLLTYAHLRAGIDISLAEGRATVPGRTPDRIVLATEIRDNGALVIQSADRSSFEDVTGGQGNDTIAGDVQGNVLRGMDGDDDLSGLAGNDTLIGGAGADTLRGGAGFDMVDYAGSPGFVVVDLTARKGANNDARGDVYFSIEEVRGSAGNDSITGSAANNVLDPGALNRRGAVQFSEPDRDYIDGAGGTDNRMRADYSDDTGGIELVKINTVNHSGWVREAGFLPGNPGTRQLVEFANIQSFTITSGSSDDIFVSSGDGPAQWQGLNHFTGDDVISAGLGRDTIDMGSGRDWIDAGGGDDLVYRVAATGPETFYINGGRGADRLVLDVGWTTQSVRAVSWFPVDGAGETIYLEGGGVITGFEELIDITTGSGDDVLIQLGGVDNRFRTGAGADFVRVDYGNNDIDAGRSTDADGNQHVDVLYLDYSADRLFSFSTFVDVGNPVTGDTFRTAFLKFLGSTSFTSTYRNFDRMVVTGTQNDDQITGFAQRGALAAQGDFIDGQGGNDTLAGGAGDDTLIGGRGADSLDGGSGDDWLEAGLVGIRNGIDTMTGGLGSDTFVLGTVTGSFYGTRAPGPNGNHAVITDFSKAEDTVILHGQASDYRATQLGADLVLTWAATNQTVAVFQNTTGFNRNAGYVEYATQPGLGSDARSVPAAAAVLPASLANTGGAGAFVISDAGVIDPLAAMLEGSLGAVAVRNSVLLRDVTVEGAAAATGSFLNAPFGLGSGIVLSTGAVTEIAGLNLADGSDATGFGAADFALDFQRIGVTAGGSVVFRAEIPDLPGGLRSLRLEDSRLGEGAGGVFSGFDLDAVILSRDVMTVTGGQAQPGSIRAIDAFDFSPFGTRLAPGEQRPGTVAENLLGLRDLAGTVNGFVNEGFARLGAIDFNGSPLAGGAVSLGDGGAVSFDLTRSVSTAAPLYLYVAEAFDAGETLAGRVTVSNAGGARDEDLSTDFGAPGPAGDRAAISATFEVKLRGEFAGTIPIVDLFNLVIVTEELPRNGGTITPDRLSVRLNGAEIAVLSDGRQATLGNLASAPYGVTSSDLILNPVGTGPLHSLIRADAYTSVLRLKGPVREGLNTIEISVEDGGDGLLDTAIFLSGVRSETIIGGAGNDSLTGTDADDRFIGRGGNDTLTGGYGFDTYRFVPDHMGRNVIVERPGEGFDRIEFGGGITPDAITFRRTGPDGTNLRLSLEGPDSNRWVQVRGQYDAEGRPTGAVEEAVFADGSVIDLMGGLSFVGTTGADRILGTAADDVLRGLGGRDRLVGAGGDDLLEGGGGADTLLGGDGNDTLIGGRGNDVLSGGVGADRFVFGAGDGRDRITDFSVAERDRLALAADLFAGPVTAAEVIATYGTTIGGNGALRFNADDAIILVGVTNIDGLLGSIDFL
ncbi:MAG: hypothetical protein ACK4TB_08215 [Gemmobacter sp.]